MKGKFVSIKLLTGRKQVVGYGVGISAKVIPGASNRNRIRRILIEWLNINCGRVKPKALLFVNLLRRGNKDEIIEDLKSVINNIPNA